MSDTVNHPDHYTEGGIETIDFITAKKLDYELGNVIKYVSRAPYKGKYLEDLKKAEWYLHHKIQQVELEQTIVEAEKELSLEVCPRCGGVADNGHDRSLPPYVYLCTKCERRERRSFNEPRL